MEAAIAVKPKRPAIVGRRKVHPVIIEDFVGLKLNATALRTIPNAKSSIRSPHARCSWRAMFRDNRLVSSGGEIS